MVERRPGLNVLAHLVLVLGVAIVAFLFQGSPWPPHALLPIPLVGAVVGVAAWGLGLWRDRGSAPEPVG